MDLPDRVVETPSLDLCDCSISDEIFERSRSSLTAELELVGRSILGAHRRWQAFGAHLPSEGCARSWERWLRIQDRISCSQARYQVEFDYFGPSVTGSGLGAKRLVNRQGDGIPEGVEGASVNGCLFGQRYTMISKNKQC